VFPVRYKLDFHMLFRRISVFKGLRVPILQSILQCRAYLENYVVCIGSYTVILMSLKSHSV
jgi:hypothetical protein